MRRAEVLDSWGVLRRKLLLIANQILAEYPINMQQLVLMRELKKYKILTLLALAKLSYTDPASTSRSVDALKKLGLISKKIDREDARKCRIELTEKGEALMSELAVKYKSFADSSFKTLSDQEMSLFLELLNKVGLRLDEILKTPPQEAPKNALFSISKT